MYIVAYVFMYMAYVYMHICVCIYVYGVCIYAYMDGFGIYVLCMFYAIFHQNAKFHSIHYMDGNISLCIVTIKI